MSVAMDPASWNRLLDRAETELLRIRAAVLERVEGVKAGQPNAELHVRNVSALNRLRQRLEDLRNALRAILQSKNITSREAQAADAKLAELIRGFEELRRLNNATASNLAVQEKGALMARDAKAKDDRWHGVVETDETRALTDTQVLDFQQRAMQDQDQIVTTLTESVIRTKQVNVEIGGELDLQRSLLDNVGRKLDRTDGAIKREDARITKLTKKQKICGWLVVIGILVAVLIALLSTNFFRGWK